MSGAGLDYERIDRERAERDKAREEGQFSSSEERNETTSD